MIQVGIMGGAGYTAGELIRILLHHPKVKISFIHSNSYSGNLITDVHTDLLGDSVLKFTHQFDFHQVDVIFLCRGHGESAKFMATHDIPAKVKIIDLSHDFRLKGRHGFVYGLPELQREKIKNTSRIANPGCFATCIQLGLLPLAHAKELKNDVSIHAITGSTGAGQAPSSTTHFSWRNNNTSVYKAFQHQHLGEITQSIQQVQNGFSKRLHFIPIRGNFTRGILATKFLTTDLSLRAAHDLFTEYYQAHPFVHITEHNPNLKQVINTNKAIIHLIKEDNQLLVVSIIDNLLKGASGQAVQNMNLIFGLEETLGLQLKGSGF